MRSIFRVGGTIAVGAGLIGMALFVQHKSSADIADSSAGELAAAVAQGDVRTVLPALDSNGDGVPDWQEILNGTNPYTHHPPATTTAKQATTTEPYTPPTTITDTFAQQFLENMVRTSSGKPLSADQKTTLVNDSVSEIAAQIQDKLYTQADIKSVAQNDLVALRDYGNKVGDVFKKTNHNANKLMILDQAVKAHDPELLKQLKPIENVYAGRIKALLALEIPSSLARQQVDLLNALSLIRSDIAAMQQVFSDPLGSLIRIRRYKADAQALFNALDHIRAALETNNVVYTSEEPGIFLFSLRP